MEFLSQQCQAESFGPATQLISTLVTTLIAVHCNISTPEMWPADYGEEALIHGLKEYDYVVIGAGSAGAVVANRLSENEKYNVLLLEAGGNPPIDSEIPGLTNRFQNSSYAWSYATQTNGKSCLGRPNDSCQWPRGRLLGGCSSMNGMLYVRGNSRDYNDWEEQGNPTWGWSNVLEYFKKSEKFLGPNKHKEHGTTGPLNVEPYATPLDTQPIILKASKELGHKQVEDFVNGKYVGFGLLYGTLERGRRMSTAKAFLRVKRPNLHIIKHAFATKINFNGKKAISVDFVYNKINRMTVAINKEVIVSAGAIDSPKLLMLSGIGPKAHLETHKIKVVKDVPGVGDNLQDHPVAPLFLSFEDDKNRNEASELIQAIYDQLIHRNGTLGRMVLNVGAFINTIDKDGSYPDIQYVYLPIPRNSTLYQNFKTPIRESLQRAIEQKGRQLFMVLTILLNPKSRGTIRLRSGDYDAPPVIFPNTFDDQHDVKTIVRGIKSKFEFENTRAFKKLDGRFEKINIPKCDQMKYKSTSYWECYIKYMTDTTFHPVGTVKMGRDTDPTAVLDSQLRIKGIEGVRVIDASIMPTIVSGNTNAPAIMIGEKGADFVKNTWFRRRRGFPTKMID